MSFFFLLYGQFAIASYLFIIIMWLMDAKVRKSFREIGWVIVFIIGSVPMALFWFLYIPLIITRKSMLMGMVHEILDKKSSDK